MRLNARMVPLAGLVLLAALSNTMALAAPRPDAAPGFKAPPQSTPGVKVAPGTPPKVKAESAEDKLCREEVAQAFAAQRDRKAFRMKTRTIDQRGVVFATYDYQLPNRMRQSVKLMLQPAPVETLLVFGRAWTRTGREGAWQPLKEQQASELLEGFQAAVVDPPRDPLRYRCTGEEMVDGRKVKTYQGKQYTAFGNPEPQSPLRIVHVDVETGLPVLSAVATQDKPDRYYFKATYSYPDDIKIEAPESN